MEENNQKKKVFEDVIVNLQLTQASSVESIFEIKESLKKIHPIDDIAISNTEKKEPTTLIEVIAKEVDKAKWIENELMQIRKYLINLV